MAVKLMIAPAIARGELGGRRSAPAEKAAEKPKRRRSSVYDADGNEVFITLMCLKCNKMRPLSQFGLRKMGDGAIRNQPWCRTCRSTAGERGRGRAEEAAAPVAAEASPVAAAAEPAPPATGWLAAQVAAALAGGARK
jgi:hypothetical protein